MLMIEENIRRKIQDLIGRAASITASGSGMARNTREISQCQGWIAETLNVIELAIPLPQNAYRRQMERVAQHHGGGMVQCVASMAQILRALLPDMDAGLLGDLGNRIRAEVFDDFLDHAELYRREGRKNESGVIAGVVFEDAIRRIYRNKIGDDKGQKLEDVINALAKQGTITGQQSKQAKVGAHVRTKATHAQWDEFTLEGVENTIQITRVLLGEHLGG
jgi:hypothetical protein